jgi:hypothetical protein
LEYGLFASRTLAMDNFGASEQSVYQGLMQFVGNATGLAPFADSNEQIHQDGNGNSNGSDSGNGRDDEDGNTSVDVLSFGPRRSVPKSETVDSLAVVSAVISVAVCASKARNIRRWFQ